MLHGEGDFKKKMRFWRSSGFAAVGSLAILVSLVVAGLLGVVVWRTAVVAGDVTDMGAVASPAQEPPSGWVDQYLDKLSGGALMAVLQARGLLRTPVDD